MKKLGLMAAAVALAMAAAAPPASAQVLSRLHNRMTPSPP